MQLPTPARLHEQHPARAAEVRAREQADAFLLGGKRDGVDSGVVQGAVDELLVAGVGDVGELGDVEIAQHPVDLVGPGRTGPGLAALLGCIPPFG